MAAKRFASLAVDEIEKKKMLINAKETMKSKIINKEESDEHLIITCDNC
jgi:hypothetical protein